ncbi:MAG: hypothetical protein ACOZF0_12615 [Thermodesulfobacteriota bacterium]
MKDVSLLIMSCDKYADLWKPFFHLLFYYWPELPFPVYLLSNHRIYPDGRVRPLAVGEDRSWSHGLLAAIGKIDTPLVLCMLEDFFLQEPVDQEAISNCLRMMEETDAGMMRLVPNPRPDLPIDGYPEIGEIAISSPYRVSTQATLWRKSELHRVVKAGESIWEFEINGTERSRSFDNGYYCVWKGVMRYIHVIERGKWFRRQARKYAAMGIGCDFSRRPVMTRKETLLWHGSWLLSHPKKLFSWQLRQKVKKMLQVSSS